MSNETAAAPKEEVDPFSKPGQIVVLKPMAPVVEKVLTALRKDENNSIHEAERHAEASQLLMYTKPCLVVLSCFEKNELIAASQFMMSNQSDIKKQNLKVFLVTKFKDLKVRENFEKLGVAEIVTGEITEYALGFKLNLHLKTLKALRAKKNEGNLDQKSGDKSGKNADIDRARLQRNEAEESPFLEIGEDVWLVKGEKPKRVGLNWLLDLEGPDPETGEWQPAGEDELGQKKWAWKATINKKPDDPPDPANDGKNGWVYAGNKPQMDPKTKKWKMFGKKPNLSFFENGENKGSKLETRKDGKLKMAKDSPQAAENIRKNKIDAAIVAARKKKEQEKDKGVEKKEEEELKIASSKSKKPEEAERQLSDKGGTKLPPPETEGAAPKFAEAPEKSPTAAQPPEAKASEPAKSKVPLTPEEIRKKAEVEREEKRKKAAEEKAKKLEELKAALEKKQAALEEAKIKAREKKEEQAKKAKEAADAQEAKIGALKEAREKAQKERALKALDDRKKKESSPAKNPFMAKPSPIGAVKTAADALKKGGELKSLDDGKDKGYGKVSVDEGGPSSEGGVKTEGGEDGLGKVETKDDAGQGLGAVNSAEGNGDNGGDIKKKDSTDGKKTKGITRTDEGRVQDTDGDLNTEDGKKDDAGKINDKTATGKKEKPKVGVGKGHTEEQKFGSIGMENQKKNKAREKSKKNADEKKKRTKEEVQAGDIKIGSAKVLVQFSDRLLEGEDLSEINQACLEEVAKVFAFSSVIVFEDAEKSGVRVISEFGSLFKAGKNVKEGEFPQGVNPNEYLLELSLIFPHAGSAWNVKVLFTKASEQSSFSDDEKTLLESLFLYLAPFHQAVPSEGVKGMLKKVGSFFSRGKAA